MTEDDMRKELRRYISQNYGTQANYANKLNVRQSQISDTVTGKRRPTRYILKDLGLKKIVTITYEPIQFAHKTITQTEGITNVHFTAEELQALQYILSNYGVRAGEGGPYTADDRHEKFKQVYKNLRRKVKDVSC
jgi:hypothetical protein